MMESNPAIELWVRWMPSYHIYLGWVPLVFSYGIHNIIMVYAGDHHPRFVPDGYGVGIDIL
jgi:hypothetical protein